MGVGTPSPPNVSHTPGQGGGGGGGGGGNRPLSALAIPKFQFLGDSNTNGAAEGVYRDATMRKLRAWRSDFEFIGSVSAVPAVITVGQPYANVPLCWYHDGHNGASIASTAAAYSGYVAAPTGAPNAVIVMLGSTDIASGRTLAQMQADWATLYAALVAANAQMVILVVPPPNIVAGSSVGANLAAWQALRNSFAAWLSGTWVPGIPRAYFVDVTTPIGAGCYIGDGLHWNAIGAATAGESMADALDGNFLNAIRSGDPMPQGITMRSIMECGQILVAATDSYTATNHPGFNPGAGSFTLAMDFMPTTVSVGSFDNVIGYGTVGTNNFYKLSIDNADLYLEWMQIAVNIGPGGTVAPPITPSMVLNSWNRIVIMADAATLTIALYLNGHLLGLQAGVTAWTSVLGNTYVGAFSGVANGAIGNYGRVQAFSAVPARPGSIQALVAVERDYTRGRALVPGSVSACFDFNGALTDQVSGNPAFVAAGTAGFATVAARPWEGEIQQLGGNLP